MTEAVAIREKRTPDELIAEGKIQATALMKVVKEAGLAKDLGGSKPHLEVEAWQTIGRFNGYLTDIVWTKPIIEAGEKVGYEARAELVRIDDGLHSIGAEACCFFNEEIERKDGTTFRRWDDDYAVRSMAQTRAQSKLGRMAFAWVAVLAGYSGTPAEEMEGVRKKGGRPIVFPFGKHKDQEPSALELKDLHGELAFWQKKVAEETNPKFKANNERLVAAIQEAIAEKTAKPESPAPPAEVDPPVLLPGGVGGAKSPPAGDVSPPPSDPTATEKLLIRIQEHLDSGKLSRAALTKYVHTNFCDKAHKEPVCDDVKKLNLLQLQAVSAWLTLV